MKTSEVINKAIVIVSAIIMGVVTFYFIFYKNNNAFDGTWKHTYFPVLIFTVTVFLCDYYFFNVVIKLRKNISEEKKYRRLINDLKSGKRRWYLNPESYESSKYFAFPLPEREASEKSGDKTRKSILFIHSNINEIRKYVKEGKIANQEETEKILSYC